MLIPAVGPEAAGDCSGMTPNLKDAAEKSHEVTFLFAEFQKSASEIEKRIDFENTLYQIRLTFAGAIIGALLYWHRKGESEGNSGRLLPPMAWSVVIVSALIDMTLVWNSNLLAAHGSWVRDCLEAALVSHTVGWESYLMQELRGGPLWAPSL